MKKYKVNLRDRSYYINIEPGLKNNLPSLLSDFNNGQKCFRDLDKKFTIDGVWGTVSMPLQPSFRCYPANTYSNPAGSQKVSWTGEAHDVNNWYNNANHRFTAPVAGNYLFMGELALQVSTLAQAYMGIGIRINGTGNIYYGGWGAKTGAGSQYEKVTSTIIKQLAANDYVEIYVELASTTTVLGGADGIYSRFSGQLLS